MMVQPAKTAPRCRQRTIFPSIAPHDARVVSERAGCWISPARPSLILKLHVAHNPRMNLMFAVELDPVPVDESVTVPSTGPTERVMLKHHPRSAARNTARARVEAHRNCLLRDVAPARAKFVRVDQTRAVIHRQPRLNRSRRRTARIAYW